MGWQASESTAGTFPEHFESGFDQLSWRVNQWTIEETKPVGQAPFEGKYSAFANGDGVSEKNRKTLELEINSENGGRICFFIYADLCT